MKRFIWSVLLMLAGAFVAIRGMDVLTTKARGEAISVMGFLIPAQDWSLYTFGSLLALFGIALFTSPLFLLRKGVQGK